MKLPHFIVLFAALSLLVKGLMPTFVMANYPLLTKRDLREVDRRLETFVRR